MQSMRLLVFVLTWMCAKASKLPECTSIDGQTYRVSVVQSNVAAWYTIVKDEDKSLFFRDDSGSFQVLRQEEGSELEQIKGIPDGATVMDLVMDDSGDIIIATNKRGFFRYPRGGDTANFYVDWKSNIDWLGKAGNGSIFGLNWDDASLKYIDGGIVKEGLRIGRVLGPFAITSSGDVYHCSVSTSACRLRRPGHVGRGAPVAGLLGGPYIMTYCSRTNKVYVGTGGGLHYLTPPATVFARVEGFESVRAMGFDEEDNLYLGVDYMQLVKLEPVPCKTCKCADTGLKGSQKRKNFGSESDLRSEIEVDNDKLMEFMEEVNRNVTIQMKALEDQIDREIRKLESDIASQTESIVDKINKLITDKIQTLEAKIDRQLQITNSMSRNVLKLMTQ